MNLMVHPWTQWRRFAVNSPSTVLPAQGVDQTARLAGASPDLDVIQIDEKSAMRKLAKLGVYLESSCCPRPGVPSSPWSTTEIDADIAEDFNLGGRGHRASPEEAGVVHPRPVRLKIE